MSHNLKNKLKIYVENKFVGKNRVNISLQYWELRKWVLKYFGVNGGP